MFTVKRHNTKADQNYDFEIALAGNPNVGKTSVFNNITGMNQHTGNWCGKTVSNAVGYCKYDDHIVKIVDLPGVYSLRPDSDEEVVANKYISDQEYDCVIIVVDSTILQRNLNLVLQVLQNTSKAVLCLNMWDEASSQGVYIDTDELSLQLGIPVVKTTATKNKGMKELIKTAVEVAHGKIRTFNIKSIQDLKPDNYKEYIESIYIKISKICNKCVYSPVENTRYSFSFDKLLCKKVTGIPIMLVMLAVVFWITIVGANYLSEYLSCFFNWLKSYILVLLEYINCHELLSSFFIDGVYTTLAWVISVMLPPMAIFFPMFSLLEDSGILPRIAFNLDQSFKNCGSQGKQALTMAMGFGCNACGVVGCRIIDSPREKNIAIITNSFVPCNGKLPALITISTIFIATSISKVIDSIIISLVMVLLILISVAVTLLSSKLLSSTMLKGQHSSFILELPPYRKPQILKTVIHSLQNRALFVLLRAIAVAVPAGAVIWCLSNVSIDDITLIDYCVGFLDPFGKILGLDGIILISFILGFTANETVIPIMLMAYTSATTLVSYSDIEQLKQLLVTNGWTLLTAVCFLFMCLFHFPCSTTCISIYKETKSLKTTVVAFVLPTIIGITLCLVFNFLF